MNSLWYALKVKTRYEQIVEQHLSARGFSSLVPRYKCRRRWSDRFQELTLPLFPGYVFCELDLAERRPVITAPGVTSIVGAGNIPIPIDEAEIKAIQIATQSGKQAEPWPFLCVGQRVTVASGPLTGLEGILVGVGQRHLVLSVTLLQRSIAVRVENSSVMPMSERSGPEAFIAQSGRDVVSDGAGRRVW
jgi:transcription antitermination factor NusG